MRGVTSPVLWDLPLAGGGEGTGFVATYDPKGPGHRPALGLLRRLRSKRWPRCKMCSRSQGRPEVERLCAALRHEELRNISVTHSLQ